ncbi:arylesterase [Sphingomonas sp. HDW15A]|uniref:arylesterase n=1 Tax=Sphingomonas sp. HDW15A TaxID=2714942 RepID=UPI00140A3FA4|nr:arylesterase [Sphingomonas sp. HDW15A]QIK95779.1 arylesterase [Sphingomonas sp. HDW15A]
MAKTWTSYGGLLLLVQALVSCSRDEPPPPAPQNAVAPPPIASPAKEAGPLIVAFGDSLFAGYGLAQNEGLAPALDRALAKAGVEAEVVNAGVSGDTSAAGLQRLAFTLDGQPRKPDLVIVGLGGNDMLRGISPEQTRQNLDAILAELKRRNIPAMLSGIIAAPNMGPDYANAFNVIYRDLAEKYDVSLYPFTLEGVVGNKDLMLGDDIHPNARGVEIVAGRMAPVVKSALDSAGA